MRRIVLLCALAAAILGVAAAQAEVTTNGTMTVPFNAFIPCANGGAGEVISGNLNLHVLVRVTINGNNLSGKVHNQPQGGTLVGAITGDIYRATGVTQDMFTSSLQHGQFTETFVNNFRLIGPGTGNNLALHETFHLRIMANGDTTMLHVAVSGDCK